MANLRTETVASSNERADIAARLKEAGVDAECTVWEGMVHCWQLFAPALDEALVSLELAGRFIAQHQRNALHSAAA